MKREDLDLLYFIYPSLSSSSRREVIELEKEIHLYLYKAKDTLTLLSPYSIL
jgi:hypothetical protein